MIKTQNLLPDTNYTCFIIPNLFTSDECDAMLNSSIKSSFQKANINYPTYYRNNDRYVVDDCILASKLFDKVEPYLPKTMNVDSNIESKNGLWNLKKLNDRIRFCKYAKNQFFSRHLDGIHYHSETMQSKLTFMIYLNDSKEFQGGRTLFYRTKNTSEIWASYIPKQGDLIVFDHNVWHEGEMLTEGEKFVLRSDILYTKQTITKIKKPFSGHLGYIWSLLKLNDHEFISGRRDTKIKVWDQKGNLLQSLESHKNSILCLEKMDSITFLSGSRDQSIKIWKNYNVIHDIKVHTAVVLSLCKIDTVTFASGSGDCSIKITHINGTLLKSFLEHTDWVWKVVKLSKTILISCSQDATIKIWDIHKTASLHTFVEKYPVISIAFSIEHKVLISGNLNGEITIRNLSDSHSELDKNTFKAHDGIIRTITIIDSNYFASGSEDNTVKIWHFNGKLEKIITHNNFVQSIINLEKDKLLSASYDGTIKKISL